MTSPSVLANKARRGGRCLASGVLLGLAGLATACSDSDAGHWVGDFVTTNDFEAMRGWVPDASALTRDHAHSGQYATSVGPGHDYSFTYDLPLSEASVHTLKGVAVEAWVYLPTLDAPASLEVQVPLPGGDNRMGFAGSLRLADQVKEAAKWTRVRQEFVFPAGLPGDAHLRIFMWRNSSQATVYLDDLRVKALE